MTGQSAGEIGQSAGEVVIVGGSLSGLMSALGLARLGWAVTVLERSRVDRRSGAALGNAEGNIGRLLGPTGLASAQARAAVARPYPPLQTWQQAHDLLQAAAMADPLIRLVFDTAVDEVGQDQDTAWAVTAEGTVYRGDLLLGSDGHRSLVRRHVAPERPDAEYAGYVIWLGIAEESEVGTVARFPTGLDILDAGPDCLLGYPLTGVDGSREPGARRLGWAWLDPRRNELLRETGCVRDGVVQHSMRDRDVPVGTVAELRHESGRWATPWRDAVRACLDRRGVTGTPISEYLPDRLVAGRVALVGDAGHVSSPMTGRGFTQALEGVEVLVAEVAAAGIAAVPAGLRTYEQRCLEPARRLVASGISFSRTFAIERV